MKPTAPLVLLACALPACAFHVHVHEAPASPTPGVALASAGPSAAAQPGTIQGLVVDEHGAPLAAHVSLVSAGGSRTQGVDSSGRFAFHDLRDGERVVTATTADRRIAVRPGVRPGEAFELPPVRPGATLALELHGLPTSRLAVLQGTTRVHDFTLREGQPVELVVPAGDLTLRAYAEGAEQERGVTLAAGESRQVAFRLDS